MQSQKSEALKMIAQMPEDSSTSDIMTELYFKSRVEKGLEDIREGRVLLHDEVVQRMSKWAKSIGQK